MANFVENRPSRGYSYDFGARKATYQLSGLQCSARNLDLTPTTDA